MKSPKDILLERHADATPALDGIRGQVVAGLRKPERKESTFLSYLRDAWRELFWQPRHVWSGLAMVWAILLVINLSDSGSGTSAPQSAQGPTPKTPIWERHNNILRAELGLPVEQRAHQESRDKPGVIHQSRRRSRLEHV